ncbi:MAG: MBL fold metallo-hydrolase, partial [Acetobacteraceae bacterium]
EIPLSVIPGVWRVVANNPGPMTYHGTNTYLIEAGGGVTVLDPGPDDAAHVSAVVAAGSGRIRRIVLSHGHRDHVGATAALRAATSAPVFGFQPGLQPDVPIDHALGEGDEVAGLSVLYTPGHAPDHLCFARADGALFSADHVMTWSTSVVSPPSGDMAAYLANLRRLVPRGDRWLLPGHGPLLERPAAFIRALVAHRLQRERVILAALGPVPVALPDLAQRIYRGISPRLVVAAERNLLGHLIKLERESRARREGDLWRRA